MSTTTTRNTLVKPDYTDAADIAVINTSLDTIDAAIAKCNYAGTAAPSTANDNTQGYSIGSVWMDRTNNNIYVAKTVTTGAAVWTLQALHNNFSATAAPTADDDITLHYAPGSMWVDITNHNVYVCEVNTDTAAVWKQVNSTTGVLLANGTVPLTADWDAGAYHITADHFVSDVADGGVAPYQTTSKVVCTNLNADMLDGLHDTSFVKQTLADAKGDLLVASGADAWAREAVSATDSYCLVSDASATNGVSWQPIYAGHARNILVNPTFQVDSNNVTYSSTSSPANNDDTYLYDQWILLSDGNDIVDAVRILTGDGYAALMDVETANKKFGLFQPLEARVARIIVGETVSLRFRYYTTSTGKIDNIMAAVVSWNSTSDTITSDIVSAWEATGTAPTLAANWTYENVPARIACATDTWTEVKIENIAIDTASTVNVGVFIWSDDTTTTAGDYLYLSQVQLNKGAVCLPWNGSNYAEDILKCRRYYLCDNSEAAAYQHFGVGVCYDTQYVYVNHLHPTGFFKTSAVTTGSASGTISTSPTGGTIETISGENRINHYVWKFGDDGKGFTASHAVLVLDAGAGTGRVMTESRL